MKNYIRAFFLILSLAIAQLAFGKGSVHVRGYTRKDGTYVAPHYRSAQDDNFYNNWSTKGNIDPYTGKEGTRITPPTRIVIIHLTRRPQF